MNTAMMTSHDLAKKLLEGPDLPVFTLLNKESMVSICRALPGRYYEDNELREFISLVPGFGVATGELAEVVEPLAAWMNELRKRHETGEYPFDGSMDFDMFDDENDDG